MEALLVLFLMGSERSITTERVKTIEECEAIVATIRKEHNSKRIDASCIEVEKLDKESTSDIY
tara:strand:- start:501 stop:689 length:189 start_codon:yes stop_codon:yes gene_type:complete